MGQMTHLRLCFPMICLCSQTYRIKQEERSSSFVLFDNTGGDGAADDDEGGMGGTGDIGGMGGIDTDMSNLLADATISSFSF
mmetsp:Transcript_62285/g.108526  ORF Transcript_62285/g.108526 Transcript_62285/m.108526 type:complete len:82 (+) Transcript_62285:86-331(+)